MGARQKMLTLKKSTQGTFMVEFAIVGVAFALVLAFCADTVIKMTVKGKLDRMSFSGVGLIKERTQLFDDSNFTITKAEFDKTDKILQNSLKRSMSNFDSNKYGSLLEVQTYQTNSSLSANPLITHKGGTLTCNPPDTLDTSLAVVTSWGRKTTLYRLTLCYDTENWYGGLVGEDYKRVSSSSLMVGR